MAGKSENKTKATEVSVDSFLAGVSDAKKRADADTLVALMKRITKKEAQMWGPSIIGFDSYHYRYDSGREGDMCALGFSPRKDSLSVYVLDGLDNYGDALAKLGPHKIGKSCLYIKRLSDVDMKVLEKILRDSYKYVKQNLDVK
ncbi:MAG: DUF1801 domain-containing protein [Planctomycetales bacterium]|nr:DUF1801 domain-containing protein [bacterium]UNM09896.1 MAG: DUF1801 domain-containing protein [Planctomycetales bacterium]